MDIHPGDFIAMVKIFFPEVTADRDALNVLWNYTGYPAFFDGDPLASCREQLAHLCEVGPETVDAEYEALSQSIADDGFPHPLVA